MHLPTLILILRDSILFDWRKTCIKRLCVTSKRILSYTTHMYCSIPVHTFMQTYYNVASAPLASVVEEVR